MPRRRARVTLGGLPIDVVSEEEAELTDIVICCPLPDDSDFTDNLTGTCAYCQRGIYFRPPPSTPAKPMKVCTRCAVEIMKSELEGPQ